MEHRPAETKWAVVRTCLRLPEAELVKSVLESEGIDAFLPDQHLLGLEPGAETVFGGARVLVRASDLDRAQQILLAMEQAGAGVDGAPDDEAG